MYFYYCKAFDPRARIFISANSIFKIIFLQDKAASRKDDLDESLHAYQYLADVTEAEAWLTEKEPLVTSTDYGKDEDSAQAMLKKHNAVMSDLEAYGTVVDQLRDQSKTCKVSKGVVVGGGGGG